MLNKVTLIGNVGQDPEVRVMQSGGKMANFSLAASEHWRDKNGEKKEATEWHKIVVYNDKLAEVVEQYIKKGSKLYIEGSIRSRKYTDSSGNERTAFEILVQGYSSTIKILDSRGNNSGNYSSEDSGEYIENKTQSEPQVKKEKESSQIIDDEIPF